MTATLTRDDARALHDCVAAGGVAVFPTDTVYGLCCDPADERAVARLYELKGRPRERAAAVMFFAFERVLAAVPEIDPVQAAAAARLLPGPVTVLLDNPGRRWAAACGGDERTLGLRVPALPTPLAALASLPGPLLQSSANLSGAQDARSVAEIPEIIRRGAGLVLDGGTLPGVPSTVVDLRGVGSGAEHSVLREGALSAAEVQRRLTR